MKGVTLDNCEIPQYSCLQALQPHVCVCGWEGERERKRQIEKKRQIERKREERRGGRERERERERQIE